MMEDEFESIMYFISVLFQSNLKSIVSSSNNWLISPKQRLKKKQLTYVLRDFHWVKCRVLDLLELGFYFFFFLFCFGLGSLYHDSSLMIINGKNIFCVWNSHVHSVFAVDVFFFCV